MNQKSLDILILIDLRVAHFLKKVFVLVILMKLYCNMITIVLICKMYVRLLGVAI